MAPLRVLCRGAEEDGVIHLGLTTQWSALTLPMTRVLNQKTIVTVMDYMRRHRGTYLTLSESTFRTVEMNLRWLWEDAELMWSEESGSSIAVSTAANLVDLRTQNLPCSALDKILSPATLIILGSPFSAGDTSFPDVRIRDVVMLVRAYHINMCVFLS